MCNILYLYYKNWNNCKLFSLKLGPPYPLRRSHLSGQKVWRKGGDIDFVYQKPLKAKTFFTKSFYIPTPCSIFRSIWGPHTLAPCTMHVYSFTYKWITDSRGWLFSSMHHARLFISIQASHGLKAVICSHASACLSIK